MRIGVCTPFHTSFLDAFRGSNYRSSQGIGSDLGAITLGLRPARRSDVLLFRTVGTVVSSEGHFDHHVNKIGTWPITMAIHHLQNSMFCQVILHPTLPKKNTHWYWYFPMLSVRHRKHVYLDGSSSKSLLPLATKDLDRIRWWMTILKPGSITRRMASRDALEKLKKQHKNGSGRRASFMVK